MARDRGWIERCAEIAIDSTGLEARHQSRHYVYRAGYKRFLRHPWPKVTAVCHTRSHLFASVVMTRGPSQDSPQFSEAVTQATTHTRWGRLLADAGYDGEHNHRLCREKLGIKSTVIALNKRNTGRKWPKTPYRREMKKSSSKEGFGQRWHIESAFSQHKRILGPALRARNDDSQYREGYLRIVTHNLMLLA